MRALDRKLLRDVRLMGGQVLAICAVMACGVATFIMARSMLETLRDAKETYYEQYRFAQVFAQLKRAPLSLVERIEDIPGVERVQTRVVRDVTLDIAGFSEPAVGRLISIPERRVAGLNDIHLRRGRYIEPLHDDEVLVSERFAVAHKFEPGSRISAIINGRKKELTIVGIALSPEYIYQIRGGGELVPDDKRFGVFWMGREALGTAFDMDGAFNDLCLDLMANATEQEVIARLDRIIAPYGGLGSYGREDQTSNRFVSDEIKQLGRMGMVVPTVFLLVASFLLNVVLSRLVSLQRDQIAALKAFGYTNIAVGWHYLKMVLAIVVIGMFFGILAGAWLGKALSLLYMTIYQFPVLEYRLSSRVVWLAFGVSSIAAVAGTLGVVRQAVKLPPAEAMRPEPPGNFRPTILERLGLTMFLSPATRMVLRNLERRPMKAVLSILGIALAVSILILGRFTSDALDYLLEVQYQVIQRYQVAVALVEPTSERVLHELDHFPGVLSIEPFRLVPVRIRHQQYMRRQVIRGVPPNPRLGRVMNDQMKPLTLPADGLALSAKLAQVLHAHVNDVVIVEVMEGERPVREMRVTAIVEEFMGATAYMEISALNRLMHEGDNVSGAYMATDPSHQERLYRDLKSTPRVASVSLKDSAIRSFKDTVVKNMLQMQWFNVCFAAIIAFGVVYNTARIALSERSRELATLRVIGFTRAEISSILLGELGVLTLVAIPVGLVIGYGMASAVARTMDTELYRVPMVVSPRTYAFAATVVVVAAVLSGLVVRRKLDHLDLIAVLKSRD